MADRYQEESPMEEQKDRGLFGMFGKKKDEGRHDQHAQYETQSKPYAEQGYGNYGHASGGEFNQEQPTYNQNTHGDAYNQAPSTYNQNTHGGAYGEEVKHHGKEGEQKGHGLLGKLRGSNSSSSSSDEEGDGGEGTKKKGLKEKIKEKLPGQHGNKREGEMQGHY